MVSFIDFLFYVCFVFVSVIFWRLDFGVWFLDLECGFWSLDSTVPYPGRLHNTLKIKSWYQTQWESARPEMFGSCGLWPCSDGDFKRTSSQVVTELLLLNCVATVCGPIKLKERSSLVTPSVEVQALSFHSVALSVAFNCFWFQLLHPTQSTVLKVSKHWLSPHHEPV